MAEETALIGPSTIAGRYEIVDKLGAGAFGTVYRARDSVLGRTVAIKTIRMDQLAAAPERAGEMRERFRREAQVAAQLKHPNILTIHDIGEFEGLSYIAMELVEGVGLDSVIAKEGPLPVARLARIGAQVADALGYAHGRSVVHRDIKPANVMLEAGDLVKVTDFGIAKPLDAADQLTATGALIGTPAYMSPEQARGEAVDGRSDLFAVGCILYEMATGQRAFGGASLTAILLKIATENPRPIAEVNPGVPAPLVTIVGRALSKDPKARYQSGGDLARDLGALAATGVTLGAGPAIETVGGTAQVPAPTAVEDPTQVASPPGGGATPAAAARGRSGFGLKLALAGAGVLVVGALLVGGLAWMLLSRANDEPPVVAEEAVEPAAAVPSSEPQDKGLDDEGRPAPSETAVASEIAEARRNLRELDGLLGAVGKSGVSIGSDDGEVRFSLGEGQGGEAGLPRLRLAERRAVSDMRVLIGAETAFKAATGRYGSLKELAAASTGAGLGGMRLRGDTLTHRGYEHSLRLTDSGFEVRAVPQRPGLRTFVGDETGEIRAVTED